MQELIGAKFAATGLMFAESHVSSEGMGFKTVARISTSRHLDISTSLSGERSVRHFHGNVMDSSSIIEACLVLVNAIYWQFYHELSSVYQGSYTFSQGRQGAAGSCPTRYGTCTNGKEKAATV